MFTYKALPWYCACPAFAKQGAHQTPPRLAKRTSHRSLQRVTYVPHPACASQVTHETLESHPRADSDIPLSRPFHGDA
jgi:hypothetical protein